VAINNNNIWEIAEAHLNGALPADDAVVLEQRLASDSAYANEFYEVSGLLRSMSDSGKQKRFRAMLSDINNTQTPAVPVKKPRLIELPAHFWRTATVAAGVALLTSTITVWSLKPSIKRTDSQYSMISREVEHLKKMQARQQVEQNQMKEDITKGKSAPSADVRYTGTGFALNNDGFFVTAYHVLNDGNGECDSVYIENKDGEYYKASVYGFNAKADIAILKVEKKNFHFAKGELPYTFASSKSALGAKIYTLGYPNDAVVYSEGYISGKNGFEGNKMQYTLNLPAGHGQSGSPLIDAKGNVLGILTAVGANGESNTYAVSSKALLDLLHNTLPDNVVRLPKTNKLGKLSREKQIEKMEAYTFSVKVFKK
jgi:serine protease Do